VSRRGGITCCAVAISKSLASKKSNVFIISLRSTPHLLKREVINHVQNCIHPLFRRYRQSSGYFVMSRYGVDPVDEAIYDTAHSYTDPETGLKGVVALAKLLGKNGTTLSKKVDPFTDTHLINIDELRAVMRATNDYSIMEALASSVDYGVFRLPTSEDITEKGILKAVLKVVTEGGDACREIDKALEDGKVTSAEAKLCADEIDEQINALLSLRERMIESVVDPHRLPKGISRITRAPKK